MIKALITGANGFLGSHVADSCVDKGYQVFALVKPSTSLHNLSDCINEVSVFDCDLRNKVLLEKIIMSERPDLIFHFGAQPFVKPSWIDPAYTIETNVIGTINVFEPLKKYDIDSKVIVACSSASYGTTTQLNRPLKESDPLMAVHPYGISKAATELLSRQYFLNFGINSVNLRLFNQTGPRKTNDACSDFIKAVVRIDLGLQEPVINIGNLSSYRDFTGIKDCLQAIWLCVEKGIPGETYNVCSGRRIQMNDYLDKALSFSSKEIKIIENSPSQLRSIDEDVIVGDNSKISELGFRINQSVEDFLGEMFTYWRNYYKKNT